MVKTLKNLLLRDQKAYDLETLYVAWGARVLPSLFSDDPGLTLIYFTARSKLVPYAFVWEKVKTMDFAETIVVYDVKVVRCSNLNEYLKLYECQRSRSLNDLGPNLSDILNFLSSIGRLKPNFMWSLLGMWERKLIQMVQVTSQRWPPCPYMVKTLKIHFSGIERPMTLKLGIQH